MKFCIRPKVTRNDDGSVKMECGNCINFTRRTSYIFYCLPTKERKVRHSEACDDFVEKESGVGKRYAYPTQSDKQNK